MEDVHFVLGQEVDVAFDFCFGEEMAGDVEVHAAPGVAGLVFDGAGGEGEGGVEFGVGFKRGG